MKNIKHYSFVFSNNNGVTVATMTMATPVKIDVLSSAMTWRCRSYINWVSM